MATVDPRTRQIFIAESRDNIKRCLGLIAQLQTAVDHSRTIQALRCLADNLCEPALLAGFSAMYTTARKFRQQLNKLDASSPFAAESIPTLVRQCHVMLSLLTAVEGGAALTAKDILAHDLKSPLGIIKATAENLLLATPPAHAAAMQRILRQASRGLELLAHWLQDDASDQARSDRGTLSVPLLLQECHEAWRSVAEGRQIHLLTEAEADLTVRAHALYLSQILSNLLGNAIKFSAAGGVVTIRALKSELPGSRIPAVLFHIIDNGRGIDEQHIPFLFLRRTQAHSSDRQQGEGLGLAICKKLCEWHGGAIWVQSKPEVGSTFSFVIPDR